MLTIHGAPPSIHTRKVIVAVLEKDLEYRVDVVFPFDPPAGWKEISPTGKIPVLSDADFRLPDSSAIVAYLDRRFPERPLYPDGDRDYAHALWLEEYADTNIAPHVIALFHEKILQPMLHGKQPDKALMDGLVRDELAPRCSNDSPYRALRSPDAASRARRSSAAADRRRARGAKNHRCGTRPSFST